MHSRLIQKVFGSCHKSQSGVKLCHKAAKHFHEGGQWASRSLCIYIANSRCSDGFHRWHGHHQHQASGSYILHSPLRSNKNTPIISRCYTSGVSDESVIFRQLIDYKSYTYTYLLGCASSGEAILIDPVLETVDRDHRVAQDLGLTLVGAANTHVHADHVTGSGELKKRVPNCRSMIAAVSMAMADVKLRPGDTIKFGKFSLEVRSTPGHTSGCLSYVWHEKGMVFTGDALLIKGCGRTDFQEGDPGALYDSVHKQIFTLPDHYKVFPAHDYTGQTMSTVGEEKHHNPRLRRPRSEFIKVMHALNLPYPKQIDKALPANMVCGIVDERE